MRAKNSKEEQSSVSSSHSSDVLTDYIKQLEAQCGLRTNAVRIA